MLISIPSQLASQDKACMPNRKNVSNYQPPVYVLELPPADCQSHHLEFRQNGLFDYCTSARGNKCKKQNWKETECSLYFLYMLSSVIWGPSNFSIQNMIPTIADYYCIYILVIRQLFYLLPVIFELSSWNYLKLSCLKIRCLTSLDHYTKSLKLWRFTKSSFHPPPPPLFFRRESKTSLIGGNGGNSWEKYSN